MEVENYNSLNEFHKHIIGWRKVNLMEIHIFKWSWSLFMRIRLSLERLVKPGLNTDLSVKQSKDNLPINDCVTMVFATMKFSSRFCPLNLRLTLRFALCGGSKLKPHSLVYIDLYNIWHITKLGISGGFLGHFKFSTWNVFPLWVLAPHWKDKKNQFIS